MPPVQTRQYEGATLGRLSRPCESASFEGVALGCPMCGGNPVQTCQYEGATLGCLTRPCESASFEGVALGRSMCDRGGRGEGGRLADHAKRQ